MASLTIPTPSVPKPKSGLPPAPKSVRLPKPASPLANAPFKATFPANPIKPVPQVGGLPGALPNVIGTQPKGPLVRAASKAVPMPKPIAQQAAEFQKKQMAVAKRIDAADKADKRARRSNRLALS